MNLIIDITISKQFDDEEDHWDLEIREEQMEKMRKILKPMIKDGYKIVMNSTIKFE